MEPFEVAVEKETACCFTGHRDIPREKSDYLIKRVMDGVKYLHSRGIKTFLAGEQLDSIPLQLKPSSSVERNLQIYGLS